MYNIHVRELYDNDFIFLQLLTKDCILMFQQCIYINHLGKTLLEVPLYLLFMSST